MLMLLVLQACSGMLKHLTVVVQLGTCLRSHFLFFYLDLMQCFCGALQLLAW